jgi:phage head maturation protease
MTDMSVLRAEAAKARAGASGAQRAALPCGEAKREDVKFHSEFRSELVERDGQEFHLVEGYASTTEQRYEMWDMFGPYHEVVSRDAFDKTLAAAPMVVFRFNHGGTAMATTANGRLELEADALGLRTRAWINPKRADVRDLITAMDDKDVTEQSFMFMINDGEWNEDYTEFRIREVDLDRGDVGPVTYGANPNTMIAARAGEFLSAIPDMPVLAAREAMSRLSQRTDLSSQFSMELPSAPTVTPEPVARDESGGTSIALRLAQFDKQRSTSSTPSTNPATARQIAPRGQAGTFRQIAPVAPRRWHPTIRNHPKGITMPGISDLIATIEVELEACQKRAAKTLKERELIITQAQQEGRSNLTEEEDERIEQLRANHDAEKESEKGIRAKLATANEVKAESDENEKKAREVKSTGVRKPAYDGVARVGTEERTYRPDTDRFGQAFSMDVLRSAVGDIMATDRLSRHMAEERVERAQYLTRAVGTGAFVGLTVPQYLTDLYALPAAALRPFADACTKHPLPADGMTVNISRITTATGVALQASENSAVQETNADDTILSPAVQTAAGQQTVSRQAIDRGTGVDSVILQDLYNQYATRLDNTLINQASTGLAASGTAVAYTDASPTGAEAYSKIVAAASGAEAALLAMGRPDIAVMHSRRWYWLTSQMSSTWPLISTPGIPTQSAGVSHVNGYGSNFRGVLPNGLNVVVDNNLATTVGAGTEDEIFVTASSECHLWEDPDAPVFIRAEQPAAASLGVLLVVYGYFAYTFGRYANSVQRVSGTGLIAPVF